MVLTPTPKIALNLVRDKNLRPRDSRPFSDYSLFERYRHMAEAADEIARLAKDLEARKNKNAQEAHISPSAPRGDDLGRTAPGTDEEDRIVAWLRDEKNHAIAFTIGARAALRVVPLVGVKFEKRGRAVGRAPR